MMASAALAVDVPNREDGLPKLLDDEELLSPENLDAEESVLSRPRPRACAESVHTLL